MPRSCALSGRPGPKRTFHRSASWSSVRGRDAPTAVAARRQRPLTAPAGGQDSWPVTKALMVLTSVSLLTLIVESSGSGRPVAAVSAGAAFSVCAVLGFGWLERMGSRRRRAWAAVYVAGMLPLGFLMFDLAGGGVGATLLLMVLVSQGVLLLPLWGAALLTGVVPLVHVGMTLHDGLRDSLGT